MLQEGRRQSWVIYKFATKGADNLNNNVRCQVKQFSILCLGRCKPLGSRNSFLSYVPQLSGANLFPSSPCFLHSVAPQELLWVEGGVASTGSQFRERSFSFGGQKLIMGFLFIDMARDIFISQGSAFGLSLANCLTHVHIWSDSRSFLLCAFLSQGVFQLEEFWEVCRPFYRLKHILLPFGFLQILEFFQLEANCQFPVPY